MITRAWRDSMPLPMDFYVGTQYGFDGLLLARGWQVPVNYREQPEILDFDPANDLGLIGFSGGVYLGMTIGGAHVFAGEAGMALHTENTRQNADLLTVFFATEVAESNLEGVLAKIDGRS